MVDQIPLCGPRHKIVPLEISNLHSVTTRIIELTTETHFKHFHSFLSLQQCSRSACYQIFKWDYFPSSPRPITFLGLDGVEISYEDDDRDCDEYTENTFQEKKKTAAINSPTLMFFMVENLTVH